MASFEDQTAFYVECVSKWKSEKTKKETSAQSDPISTRVQEVQVMQRNTVEESNQINEPQIILVQIQADPEEGDYSPTNKTTPELIDFLNQAAPLIEVFLERNLRSHAFDGIFYLHSLSLP
jgi:hypothetical protein